MRRKVKWGNTVLAIALAGAMTVTSFNTLPMVTYANDGIVQLAETRSMHYDGTNLTAVLDATDPVLNPGEGKTVREVQFFYAVYDSMSEAQADDIGAFNRKAGGVHFPKVEIDGSYSCSCEASISRGQVVRYYFNVLYNNAEGKDAGACVPSFQYYSYANDSESPDPVSETGITKLEVYDQNNGPQIEYKENVFSFCLPKVNGEAIGLNALDSIKKDFNILIKKGDSWVNIEDASSGLIYDEKARKNEKTWKYELWGNVWAIVFNIKENSSIRFQSVAHDDVYVDYTLNYPGTQEEVVVTSLAFPKSEVDISSQGAYAIPFDSLIVNGGNEIAGSKLQTTDKRLNWYIDPKADGHFYELGTDGSGLIWDKNYGWDGAQTNGGFWFNPIKNTVIIKVELKDNPSVHAEIKLVIDDSVSEKGAEYDFTKDNSAYDYADQGTSKDGYDLIWADEFDGNYGSAKVDASTGLNLDNWSYQLGDGTEVGNPGWGNQEKQSYTSNKKNIAVNEDLNGDGKGDGMLRLTASYEKDGYKNGSESEKDYTSARIRTTSRTNEALFTTTYGYIESRMALPSTKGAWPAFWMLPQSTDIYGNWPVSGEIDIMETCGAFKEGGNNKACGTLHWGAPEHVYKGSGYVDLKSDYNYFHTYAIDWEPGKITWYYDGVAINTLQNWESMISGSTDSLSYDAPFDQPFYILLNLAVDSGMFGGDVNRATFQDNINMYVDYVRAYQKSEGYVESVDRTASDNAKNDWDEYEGVNQIADVTEAGLDANGFNEDKTSDASKWYLSYNANNTGGKATLDSVKDKNGRTWAKVGISEAGSQDYSVQLIGHYNAKAGYVYKVSFDAYADGNMVGKSVNTDSKEWAGWSTNGIQSYELSSTTQHVAFTFEQKSDFEKCRIEFNLGSKATGNVYISNVKVEIVNPESINSDSGRKPLANGDVIYNGTFDQGSAHVGGWVAAEGTSLSIPRYTTEKIADSDVSVVDTASISNKFEHLTNGGVKYYERRAQISSKSGAPRIYQPGIELKADGYALNFDMYSKSATTVQAAIYSVTEDGKLGTKMLESPVVNCTETGSVKNYKWAFTTPRALVNAALVLTFGDGASVQIDNVSMIGNSQAEVADENPVNANTQWNANGADGGAATDAGVDTNGVHKFTEIKSGSTWYSPQITSAQFKTLAGAKYKMTAQLKLEGTSNNKVSYIVQNQGSWEVVQSLVEIDLTQLGNPDADGYYTYTKEIKCPDTTYSNVALNFGLGNSEAKNATFYFKNVTLKVIKTEDSGSTSGDDMGETQTGIAINYILGADDAVNADANPFYYNKGEGKITLAAPSRDGYLFAGWTLAADSKDYITEVSTDADAITVYAHWTVRTDAQIPVISKQPATVKCNVGGNAVLAISANAPDNGALSYQWYKNSTARIKNATSIDGATESSYTADTSAVGTTYYFCVVTNTNEAVNGTKTATATSNIVAVEVTAKTSEPDHSGSTTTNPSEPANDNNKPSKTDDKPASTITGVKNNYTVKSDSKSFTIKAEGYGEIKFASSNSKVATIDPKTGKVKVKGPGIVKITVTASGDDEHAAETKVITIKIAPKKAIVKAAKSTEANQLTISWKRDAQVSGYEIQYSTDKNFKNAKSVKVGKNKTTNKSIDNLKSGKKYYIRIRSYKTVGKTKLNGSWSKTDSATTK